MEDQTNQEVNVEHEQKQVDPIVQKAMEMGWRPQEEWQGPPEDFIDAKEFVRRKPLFEKIEAQSRALKNLAQDLEALKQHHAKVKETEFKRAYEQLKQARKTALTAGETEQALLLEEKIDELKEAEAEFKKSLPQTTPTAQPPEAFTKWVNQNPWYQNKRAMTAFADRVGIELHQQGLPPEEVLKQVEVEVRKEFPEYFTNPKRESAPSVEGGSRRATPQKQELVLSDEEKQIMNRFVRSGVMTKDEYLAELKRIRG